LVPNFRFSLRGKDTVTFDPVQLSDGTLRIFGMLLAIYQSPAPRLLVIEEPEQTVHPGVLGVLADAFKEAAEATQIIITTHSPHLVDYFRPEDVRVVSLQEGLTTVERVRKTQVEAVKRRLMSLQEFMLAEGLQGELS
jgi:predicted ATPase